MAWEWPKAGLSETDRIKQNLSNITQAIKGDIPYERDMGMESEWIDKPVEEYDAALLTDMADQYNYYEDRVITQVEIENEKIKVAIKQNE